MEQFKKKEAPPIGGREPLQEDENGKLNRTPGGQGGLGDKGSKRNGNGNGKPHENGGSGGNDDPNGSGGPGENGEPPRRGGEEPSGRDDDEGGDGSSSPASDTTPPRRRRHRRPRFVYVVQGPPGPPGQMGQPRQAGRDGQAPQLTKALKEALRAQRGNLDTTGLENSFDYFGKTMTEVLNAQQGANRNLEEQFRKTNETQESQVEAMQDMAQVNYQMKFDHMFASVPIYDGTDPDSFDDWLYQIESLCELSQRDVRIELMGRASAHVKHLIRSLPLDTDWETARRELKRCLTEEKSRADSAYKLAQIKQKPNENLRIFILRYQDLHAAATGKGATDDTDPTHIIRFLGMMSNSEIARKITQKGIPEGMTLGQAFTKAIELEAGYQLSEGVSLARPTEVMQVQEVEEVDEIGTGRRKSRDVVCWQCGEKGHLQCNCPYKMADDQVEDMDDPNAYAGRSEQIIRINQPITVATRDNIYKQMRSQRTKPNIYKTGYRKIKAALQEQQRINAAITSTLAAQAPNAPTQPAVTPQRVYQTRTVQTPMVQQTVAQTPVVQQSAIQTSATPAQVVQLPTTSGPSVPTSVPSSQGKVRYIKLPPGITKGTYNLRPVTLNNTTVTNTPVTNTVTPTGVGRSKTGAQVTHVKQEPPIPGITTAAKANATTTVVRKGRGRGKKTSTVSVLDNIPDENGYYVEVGGEEFSDSDSDATELYEILANLTGQEEEAELDIEPEIEPPI